MCVGKTFFVQYWENTRHTMRPFPHWEPDATIGYKQTKSDIAHPVTKEASSAVTIWIQADKREIVHPGTKEISSGETIWIQADKSDIVHPGTKETSSVR
jgi:hypothetical protein